MDESPHGSPLHGSARQQVTERVRSLLPLLLGVGGLGLAIALLVDGVQRHTVAAKQAAEDVPTEPAPAAEPAPATPAAEPAAAEPAPATAAEPAPAESSKRRHHSRRRHRHEGDSDDSDTRATVDDPVATKREAYERAYLRARSRAPVDPRALAVLRGG